jgi:hypothetical protein
MYACKILKNDGGFDRDTHNIIKCGLYSNINSSTFKNSIVNTSGCKYWKINFDPDDKDDTYMILTQSSKEQYIDECNGRQGLQGSRGARRKCFELILKKYNRCRLVVITVRTPVPL